MTKEELLNELVTNTFLVLRPSPLSGVGVFAIRDIPKGTRTMFSPPDSGESWTTVSKKEMSELPVFLQELITNYCLFDEDNYFVPDGGFKKMDLAHYLNHSETPNIVSIEEGAYFEAIRDIVKGDELLVDYGTLVDSEE